MLNQFFLFNINGKQFLSAAAVTIAIFGLISWFWPPFVWMYILVIPFVLIGLYDMYQTENTIIRNFPVLGHMRYLLMSISPEIRQYFVESNTDGKPFNKNQRNFVNKRSENKFKTHPFGSELDMYEEQFTWAAHSIYPEEVKEKADRVVIGNNQCDQHYEASIYNISAMSFGSLSAPAIQALNKGAKMGDFFHNTGEGGISPHHLEYDADLVWEIGSAYFGCRTPEGDFNPDEFRKKAQNPNIKMIELKLSQGAKPGHGGVLPADKNTPEIAEIRGVEPHTKIVSPAYHKEFSDAVGLLHFIDRMRELSGGKPTGFKLCIGKKSEFHDICSAMIQTGIVPDFISVDGAEGGTGAAPIEFSDSIGMPLEEALVFVTDSLRGFDLYEHIKVIAAGKVITGFDIIKAMALGADACNSARGMMFALGCIQALKCDTNDCPTGVTTHDPNLTRGLVVEDKAQRVANFQRETVDASLELLAGMGLKDYNVLERKDIQKRVEAETIRSFEEIYPSVKVGAFL